MLAFLAGSVSWIVSIGLGMGVYLAVAQGSDLADLTDPATLGATAMLQIVGIGVLALLLGDGLRASIAPDRSLAGFLGLRPAAWTWYVAAAIGGCTVWTFPSWLATRLTAVLGWEGGTVTVVTNALQEPLAETWPLILAVGVSAPLFEEVIFRGYMWTLLERSGSPALAFGLSTLLFAAYHVDPVHVVSILPTAMFLGWVRWQSGSIWPAVLAHFVNNALAIIVAQSMGPDSPTDALPLGIALAGLGVTVLVAGFARWFAPLR